MLYQIVDAARKRSEALLHFAAVIACYLIAHKALEISTEFTHILLVIAIGLMAFYFLVSGVRVAMGREKLENSEH